MLNVTLLHCNVVMKVTNEKKGIVPFYLYTNKNFNETISICITAELINVSIKVLIINKSQHTHHNHQ